MLISLTTYCFPFSLDFTKRAFPNDPSPIFFTLWYLSILTVQTSKADETGSWTQDRFVGIYTLGTAVERHLSTRNYV